VLCEDYLSAIKIGRNFNAIPLFGTFIPDKLFLSLIPLQPIIKIWLDFNKAQTAIKQTNKGRQWIQSCSTIITEKDPKEYSTEEIQNLIIVPNSTSS
jgi:hypothetical protein